MIIYLHGFRSGPQSSKVQALSRRMRALGHADALWCRQLPHGPADALALAEMAIETAIRQTTSAPTLVGSSLGGFYASSLAEKHGLRAVLINPFVPHADFDYAQFVGIHTNLYTAERFCFTETHLAELHAADPAHFTHPENLWLLAETADEVLDYRHAAKRYSACRQTILEGGDHSFTRWADYIDAVLAFAGLLPELSYFGSEAI